MLTSRLTVLCMVVALCYCNNVLQFSIDQDIIPSGLAQPAPLRLKIRVSNLASYGVTVSNWDLPFESSQLNGDLFEINAMSSNSNGQYVGRLVKRDSTAMFALSNTFYLEAKETKEMTVDFSFDYYFPNTDQYSITLNTIAHYKLNITTPKFSNIVIAPQIRHDQVISNTIKVFASPFVDHRTFDEVACDRSKFVVNCTATRTTQATNAAPVATSACSNAINYLTNCKKLSYPSNYTRWFGANNITRFNIVKANFNNVLTNLKAKSYTMTCTCDLGFGVFAYVYPTDSCHVVHLCSSFWFAPSEQGRYDSKPGTITHELSHFNDIAGTNDYAYGTSTCENLAKSNPLRASRNADNYEFFQETNTDATACY